MPRHPHVPGRAQCKKTTRTWIQKSGVVGAVFLLVFIFLWAKENARWQAEVRQARVCAEVDAFVRMLESGIITPPYPTPEQLTAIELANSKMRELLHRALLGSPCG